MTRTIHCTRCHRDLTVEAFPAARVKPGTKNDRCRKCLSRLARAWNLRNADRCADLRAKYRTKIAARRAEWGRKNREYLAQWMKRWREKNRDRFRANLNSKGPLQRGGVMPAWASKAAIRAFYIEARRLTKETGVQHHVDHIIPLKGRNVCGLHVETNLQIISAVANRQKGNRLMEAHH